MSAGQPPQKLSLHVENLLQAKSANSSTSMDELAKSLDMSVCTLHRRLAEQRTTFREIIENWRVATAKNLLRRSEIRINLIARRLGYSHASNFERAFKRWTGVTPSAWRNRYCRGAGPK